MLSSPLHPGGLWYGYDLPAKWFKRSPSNPAWRSRTKEERKMGMYEQPPAAALDHPKITATTWGDLLLPFAKRLEQMPQVECAATERVLESKRMDRGSSESQTSADTEDEYGTLA